MQRCIIGAHISTISKFVFLVPIVVNMEILLVFNFAADMCCAINEGSQHIFASSQQLQPHRGKR